MRRFALNRTQAASLPSWLDKLAYLQSAADSYRNVAQIELLEEKNPERAFRTWLLFKGDEPGRDPRARSAGYRTGGAPLRVTYAVLPAGVAVFSERGDSLGVRLVGSYPAESNARAFLRLCADPASSPKAIRKLGRELFDALLAPELKGAGAAGIDIRVDGWLAAIPFGALTDESGAWVGRSYALRIVTGPPAFAPQPETLAANSSATILSAPSAESPGGTRLPLLSSADAEAADVASHFSNATILRDAVATVQRLDTLAPHTAIFHFAGHGWSNGGNGALLLPPIAGNPQFITSKELSRQNWRRCALAVLSACLTATGEQRGPVNNESLVQALLSAGARNVLASRWSVDSESTRALMSRIYTRLCAGGDAPAALEGAAAEISSLKEWGHPFYWAGFDVFGKEKL